MRKHQKLFLTLFSGIILIALTAVVVKLGSKLDKQENVYGSFEELERYPTPQKEEPLKNDPVQFVYFQYEPNTNQTAKKMTIMNRYDILDYGLTMQRVIELILEDKAPYITFYQDENLNPIVDIMDSSFLDRLYLENPLIQQQFPVKENPEATGVEISQDFVTRWLEPIFETIIEHYPVRSVYFYRNGFPIDGEKGELFKPTN